MCIGARGGELKIIFQRQLSDAGDTVKEFPSYLSCPRPCVLSVPVAWSVAGLVVKNWEMLPGRIRECIPPPPQVTSHAENVRLCVSHRGQSSGPCH